MKACKRVMLDGEGVCNLPDSFDETALARERGTVEIPLDISIVRVLEPLLESSEPPDYPSSPGYIVLICSLFRQILHGNPDRYR